jgi:predicted Fe-Mo cluster-binding NifX family protein
MKIALPSCQNRIDEHFGHCESFTIFTIDESKKITSRETFVPPAGCGCNSGIAPTLAQMGVKLMLAGNMGPGAVNVLTDHGIQVVRGCSGDVEGVVESWLSGGLSDSGLTCCQHEHGCHES